MHWVLGKRREQHTTAVEAARATARATRVAATVGLVGSLLTVGGAVAVEAIDHESIDVSSCTAVAIQDYMYLYEGGAINHDEFEALRTDAIAGEVDDTAAC
jgi:hypothetical protein